MIHRTMRPKSALLDSPDGTVHFTERLHEVWTMMVEIALDKVCETGDGEEVEILWDANCCRYDIRGLRAWVGIGGVSGKHDPESAARWIVGVLKERYTHRGRRYRAADSVGSVLRPVHPQFDFYVSPQGDDRRNGVRIDQPLKTHAEVDRRVRYPNLGELFIQEMSPWGPRIRCTDRYYSARVACPEVSR